MWVLRVERSPGELSDTHASEVISGAWSGRVTPCHIGGRGLDNWDIDPQHRGRRVTIVAPAVQLVAQERE